MGTQMDSTLAATLDDENGIIDCTRCVCHGALPTLPFCLCLVSIPLYTLPTELCVIYGPLTRVARQIRRYIYSSGFSLGRLPW